MESILRRLASAEGGRRLILNLLEGLNGAHIGADRALALIEGLADVEPAGDPYHPYLPALEDLVYARPDHFQFHGPAAGGKHISLMTVKPYPDLMRDIRETSDRSEADLEERLGIGDLRSPSLSLEDGQFVRIAEAISDPENGIRFMLARMFDNPADGGAKRPVPTWCSCWTCVPLPSTAPKPSDALAGRVRDWLGLTYAEKPLFVIRSRRPSEVDGGRAFRPTIFEGVANELYKHRASRSYVLERRGSTIDIVGLRGVVPDRLEKIEGGPEIVARALAFDPETFECLYLGKAPRLAFDPQDESFHKLLLAAGETMDSAIFALARILDKAGEARP